MHKIRPDRSISKVQSVVIYNRQFPSEEHTHSALETLITSFNELGRTRKNSTPTPTQLLDSGSLRKDF